MKVLDKNLRLTGGAYSGPSWDFVLIGKKHTIEEDRRTSKLDYIKYVL